MKLPMPASVPLLAALAACVAPAPPSAPPADFPTPSDEAPEPDDTPDAPLPEPTEDTDAPVDTDAAPVDAEPPADTDAEPADTEPPPDDTEAPAADTGLPEPVEPGDTDPVSDPPPADTDDVIPPSPTGPMAAPSFRGGFVRRGADLLDTTPLFLDAGNRSTSDIPGSSSAVFADVDGDGTVEVVVTSTTDGPTQSTLPRVQVFDWTALGLAHDAAASAALQTYRDAIGALVDLDRDGHLDVLLSRATVGLARGTGPGRFAAAEPLPLPPGYTGSWNVWGHAPYDLDNDGLLDLVIGDRSCRPDSPPLHLVAQEGRGTYVDRTASLGPTPDGTPWTVMVAPTPEGEPVLGMIGGHCDPSDPLPGFFRVAARDTSGWPTFTGFDPTPPGAAYRQLSVAGGGPLTTTNPMGVALADFNADGRLDLSAALDAQLFPIFSGFGTWPMADISHQEGRRVSGVDPMFSWGMAALDLDLDGVPDLVTAHGDDIASWLGQWFVGAHPVALWSDGAGGFVDRTHEVGLRVAGNWRALSVGDPDADGDLDLLVGGFGQLPAVFENQLDAGHHGLTLALVGTTSNVQGIGAQVEVIDRHVPRTRHLVGGVASPMIWTEPVLGLGLGADATLDLLRITWPSGVVQEVRNLQAGRLHRIEEPRLLDVIERVTVSAAPTRTFTLRVFPQAPDGSPRVADVDVVVVHGPGTWTEPAGWDDTTWERTLSVPPGSAPVELTVHIDGVPLRQRVRLR